MGAPGGRCSCAPCWRGRVVAVLASFAALALFAALSGLSTAAPAQAQSGPGLADPPANVPRTQAMDLACGEAAGPPCQQAAVQAINQERAIEGVRPLSLPAGYNSLSTQRQLLVLADLERVDRGLPGFTGLSTRLDGLAEKGALSKSDPTGPPEGNWGSNWAGGESSALLADYDWMYDDGAGSPNIDCASTVDQGCWSHRRNILAYYGPHPSMGAAAVSVDGMASMAELFSSASSGRLDYSLATQEARRGAPGRRPSSVAARRPPAQRSAPPPTEGTSRPRSLGPVAELPATPSCHACTGRSCPQLTAS